MGRTVALVKKECCASSMVLAEHQVIIRASLGADFKFTMNIAEN